MITHYFDIHILGMPRDENMLRNRLYPILHGTISRHAQGTVAFGFPDYNDITLGKCIRAFGPEPDLQLLAHQKRLIKLAENNAIHIDSIAQIPADIQHVRYVRDRFFEKHGAKFLIHNQQSSQQSETENLSNEKNDTEEKPRPPFIKFQSSSNKHYFSLYIRKEIASTANPGRYSKYGLSKDGSTVPLF